MTRLKVPKSSFVHKKGSKIKSKKQVGFLLSDKVSPLSDSQKAKLKRELHAGTVKVRKSKKSKR